MKIEKKEKGVKKLVKEVAAGEVFKLNESYYLKFNDIYYDINLEGGRPKYFNCYNLNQESIRTIEPDTEVKVVVATLLIED